MQAVGRMRDANFLMRPNSIPKIKPRLGLDWYFGEMDSCPATMAEAIALAKEVNEMPGLAVALCLAALLGYCKRNTAHPQKSVFLQKRPEASGARSPRVALLEVC
jgi:hypothetical protein